MSARGFTLIEVLTALVISGIVVSVAAAMLTQTTRLVTDAAARARSAQDEANGIAWLREAFFSADASTEADGSFEGSPDTVRFRTTLPVSSGWPESTTARVTIEAGRIVLAVGTSRFVVSDSSESAVFDYLAEYGAGSPWLRRWSSPARTPYAIRLRRVRPNGTADTLLFQIGRGL